ncbi:hypothetical protein QYF61_007749 [Mycteria americana]|uniref:Uncharacterized protein n=1 Tax=Mycteria americana TaxID=33587 RepID=A0AAN7RU62_MYCAM|nr:hypothetical protein QYF61_007749 [Mycteria americana]
MMKELEHFSYAERLGELRLFSLEKARGDLMNVHLMGGNEEEGAGRSSAVPSGRTRGKGHKLQNMKLNLNTRKNFRTATVVKHCSWLPAEAVESPPLESTQNLRGHVLGNLLWVTLLEQEGLDSLISKVLKTSMIL